MKKHKLLFIILTLVMLLGQMPEMSMTTFAGDTYRVDITNSYGVTESPLRSINDIPYEITCHDLFYELLDMDDPKCVFLTATRQSGSNITPEKITNKNATVNIADIGESVYLIKWRYESVPQEDTWVIKVSKNHVHSFAVGWTKDATYHWHVCTSEGNSSSCLNASGAKKAKHVYGTEGDARFTCSTCQYVDRQKKSVAEAADNQTAADVVIAKISAIGTVEYTTESKTKIDEARDAYEALSDAQKELVTNYSILTDSETAYQELEAVADQVAADAVIAKISAIGTVEYTTESKTKIDEARDVYEALSDTQKTLVANYSILTAAETTYAELEVAADQAAADVVIATISTIGTVEYTTESKTKIDEAREAYDALSDTQKVLVTNYSTLMAAETTYEELEDVAAMQAAADDFQIVNGVLVKYDGAGGDVVIPNGVTSIGDRAFNMCDSLTSITIPEGVTRIGIDAFYQCLNLRSVSIPNSVSIIDDHAFDMCCGLTSITIPSGVISIGEQAFYYCYNLRTITFTEGLESIGNHAFDKCSSLTEITLPDSVTEIGHAAFLQCTGLTSVTIPYGLTTLELSLFNGCSSLTTVTIPASVTSIDVGAFYSCNGLTDVYYGGSEYLWIQIDKHYRNYPLDSAQIHYSGQEGTWGNRNKWTIDDHGTLTIFGSGAISDYSFSGEAPWHECYEIINKVIITNGIIGIGNYAFFDLPNMTEILIPDSVTSIGIGAFDSCINLTSVSIPDSVTYIGAEAFVGCTNLKEISLSSQLTSIESGTFLWCSNLTDITIPSYVASVGTSVFRNCTSLESIILPNKVTKINDYVFSGCTSLKNITLSSSIKTISQYAFDKCAALTDVFYGGSRAQWNAIWKSSYGNGCLSTATIHYPTSGTCGDDMTWTLNDTRSTLIISGSGNMTDYSETQLPLWNDYKDYITNVVIEEGITGIGNYAFYGMNMTEISIPEGVTSIGDNAFELCSNLLSISLPSGLTSIGKCSFFQCDSLEGIILPPNLTSIGENAFWKCENLSEITIPEGVTSLGSSIFAYCTSLRTATISAWVTSIPLSFFSGCSNLEAVTMQSTVRTIENGAFFNCNSLKDVYYGGRKPQWETINKTSANRVLDSAIIHYPMRGSCGENATWVVDDSGKLTISGTGAMKNYQIPGNNLFYAPWHDFADMITEVVIEEGITAIGSFAFYELENLESVTIPNSVSSLEYGAFEYCRKLESITIPDGVQVLSTNLFWYCSDLAFINLPSSIVEIQDEAFRECSNSAVINYPGSPYQWDQITIDKSGSYDFWAEVTINCLATYPAGGACGNDMGWVLDEAGTLIITGNGVMTDYTESQPSPWYQFADTIAKVIISEDITHIGNNAFAKANALSNVDFNGSCLKWSTVTIGPGNESLFADNVTLTTVNSDIDDHAPMIDAAVAPTCTETGLTEGKHCSVCNEVLIQQEVVPATGHDWYSASYVWANDNSSVSAKHTCKNDRSHVEEETVSVTWTLTKSPTETTKGERHYVSDAFSNTAFSERSRTIADVPALNTMMGLTLPTALETISDEAFADGIFQYVIVPDICTYIGHKAFANCGNLVYIKIPASVQTIETDAFEGCGDVIIDRLE